MLTFGEQMTLYPDYVMRMIVGADAVYAPTRDKWVMSHGGRTFLLDADDYKAVCSLRNRVWREFVTESGFTSPYSTEDLIEIRSYATECIAESREELKVLFVSDESIGALRRCEVPARAMNMCGRGEILAECVKELDVRTAMHYDIIVVRETTVTGFVTIRKLQEAGKVIIYDVDEYLFDLPLSHPKHGIFTQLDSELHYELLRTADCIGVRSEALAKELLCEGNKLLLPDMVDTCKITPVSAYRELGKLFRVICISEEWEQEAVDMLDQVVRDAIIAIPHIRFTFVGCIPESVRDGNRVSDEYSGYVTWWTLPEVDKRYTLVGALTADVALVPRLPYDYHKFGFTVPVLELLSRGLPVLCGPCVPDERLKSQPRFGVIESPDMWVELLLFHYNNRNEPWYGQHTMGQIAQIRGEYDAPVVGMKWKEALLRLGANDPYDYNDADLDLAKTKAEYEAPIVKWMKATWRRVFGE